MGVDIKLTDRQLPVSPVFVDFLERAISGAGFDDAKWHDQLSEELSHEQREVVARAAESAQKVIESPLGQEKVRRAYELLVALMTGDTQKIRDIQFRFHFINIVGVPRHGGSYLTGELYRSLGYDPEKVPNVIAHDGFPEASPFRFQPGVNSWMSSLQTMAEYLTMVEMFFGKRRPHTGKIIVPKKLLKGTYAGGFFHRVLGESVEHILTVRHPVTSAISTYEKSGGLPENGKFAIRGNIEEWIRRDLEYTGVEREDLVQMDYFDAYLRYWEQYHYYVATTGLSANRNIDIVPYSRARMMGMAQRFHNRFESGLEASDFKVFDKRDRHPAWFEAAEPAVQRVAQVWHRVGLDFPVAEILEAW
ncbi:MAG: hypothetical protein VX663_02030 [Pseudomonadota bacterium]|nr:hypothetical protein [Pseudomonadota bacterium]